MSVHAIIGVELSIAGPFMCAETGPVTWGVDKAFSRDFNGGYYIDRSHIKGKLREALKELHSQINIAFWFGKDDQRDEDNNTIDFDGDTGRLLFSNFYPQNPGGRPVEKAGTITRIRINERGTAEDNMLFVIENPFPASSETLWSGSIEYFCSNPDEAKEMHDAIRVGFKWITAFGAMKGIGMGALRSVRTSLKTQELIIPEAFSSPAAESSTYCLGLRIEPLEPFLALGPKKKENYFASDAIIRGNMIKGALAEALNRKLDPKGALGKAINEENEAVKKEFPLICKYFGNIIVSHAFPTHSREVRPVVIPDSTVMVGDEYYDMVFKNIELAGEDGASKQTIKKPDLRISDSLPVFKTDWKTNRLAREFGWAEPRRVHKTRTAIDSKTRIAVKGQLYTFQYTCPVDSQGNKIYWLSNISLSNVEKNDREPLMKELLYALPMLDRIGKRKSKVAVEIEPGRWAPKMGSRSSDKPNIHVLVLQSDALMIDPSEIAGKEPDLFEQYNRYFDEATEGKLRLIDFYATEKLLGGFVARNLNPYYPYFLTEAGSVFVLKYAGESAGEDRWMTEWLDKGLPLPEWLAISNIIPRGVPLWKVCPFVPENGYGEAVFDLDWHWSRAGTNSQIDIMTRE